MASVDSTTYASAAPPAVVGGFHGPEITIDTGAVKEALTTTGESFALGAAAGFFGGVCQTYAGQPFDTVKVRMQTSSSGHGFVRTALGTFRHEGIRGLYRGTTPALVFGLVENTIAFGANEQLKRQLIKHKKQQGGRQDADLSLKELSACGAVSGLVHCGFSCPTEVIKTNLQVEGSTYRGPIQCAQSILKSQGIAGLYAGFAPFILREVPFYLCFFATYEVICGKFQRNVSGGAPRSRDSLTAVEVILAGGLAGSVGWSGVQPMDTAMVRMQTGKGAGGQSGSFLLTCRDIYRVGGVRGFFPGWMPAMLRAFPANAALFLGFEAGRRTLNATFGEE